MTTPSTEAARPDWFAFWTETEVPRLENFQLAQIRAMSSDGLALAERFPPFAVCREQATGRAGIVIGYGELVENRHGTLCGFIPSTVLISKLREHHAPSCALSSRRIPGVALASAPIGEARVCAVRVDDLELVAHHGPVDADFVRHVASIAGDA